MQETILIVYLVVSIALVGIILLQQGKGAEMGASFGAGGANTVFGAAGSGNVLTKTTTILAILFFAIALSISYLNSTPSKAVDSVLDEAPATETLDAGATGAKDKGLEGEIAPSDESPLKSDLPAADVAKKPADAAAKKDPAVDKVKTDAKKAADEQKKDKDN